jgi:hypothetical protein
MTIHPNASKFVSTAVLFLAMGVSAFAGCTGMIGEAGGRHAARGNGGDGTGIDGTSGASGIGKRPGGAVGTDGGGYYGDGGPGSTGTPGAPAKGALVPTHVRLLNNVEYNNTVAALLGDKTAPANAFPPPAAQQGFTNNSAQVVGSLLGGALDTAAQALAATAVKSMSTLLPCDPAKAGEDACAASFIASFAARAFRRPLTEDDKNGLMGIYTASRMHGGDFTMGIQNVVYGVLASGSFLYITELGTTTGAGATSTLTPYEVAAALSYFILASPPDDTLVSAAASNSLSTPDQIEAQARRLLADARSQPQIQRFVKEWFEIKPTTKDPGVYPDYAGVAQSSIAETGALIDDVMVKGDGSLKSLLTANYTFVDKPLAAFYGLTGSIPATGLAKVSVGSNRLGILTHASFLASHGDQATSSPIKRGVFVRRRVFCQNLPAPPPGVNTTPPMSTGTKTTRQLFDEHIAKPACSMCHDQIDPIGNGFEHFDGAGKYRATDSNIPVDSTGNITDTLDADAPFDGVPDLANKLAASAEVNSCFGRQVFRFASAQNGPATEQQFINEMAAAPTNYKDIVVAFVRTSMFGKRLVQ